MAFYFTMGADLLLLPFLSKSRRQQLDTLKMESLIKELELRTIKAHINPHFIFNSLNSIRALVDEKPAKGQEGNY